MPTGDGMCIAFLQGIELPLKLAIELQEKLDQYNKGKITDKEFINGIQWLIQNFVPIIIKINYKINTFRELCF